MKKSTIIVILNLLFACKQSAPPDAEKTFDLFESLDKGNAELGYIAIPSQTRYSILDSCFSNKYNFKVYRFKLKQQETLNEFYVLKSGFSDKVYVVPSQNMFVDKFYLDSKISDQFTFPLYINPKYHRIFFDDLENFYNNEIAEHNYSLKEMNEINRLFLEFYFKDEKEYGINRLLSPDSIDVVTKVRFLDHITDPGIKGDLIKLNYTLKEKLRDENCIIYFSYAGFLVFELYTDQKIQKGKRLILDFIYIERDYFYFRQGLIKKTESALELEK